MSKAILITKTLGHASILGVRNLTAEAVDARLWHSTSAGVHEGCKVRSIDEILTADSHWKQLRGDRRSNPPVADASAICCASAYLRTVAGGRGESMSTQSSRWWEFQLLELKSLHWCIRSNTTQGYARSSLSLSARLWCAPKAEFSAGRANLVVLNH